MAKKRREPRAATLAIQSQHGLYTEVRVNGMTSGQIAVAWFENQDFDAGPVTTSDPVFRYTFSRPRWSNLMPNGTIQGNFGGVWAAVQQGPAPWDWNRPFTMLPDGLPITTTPAVDSVSPGQGPVAGGTSIRLQDNSPGNRPGIYDRTDAGVRSWVTRVRIGSGNNPPQGTGLSIANAKTLQVTTPAGTAGNQPITLDYNIGSQAINGIATGRTFNYQLAPIVATVTGVALTASVTVTQNLTGTAQARIYWDADGAPSSFVTVTGNNPTATYTYPQPGQYRIRVLRVSDSSETTLFYTTLPAAEWVFPAGGSPRGGEVVTLYGQLMSLVTGANFGSRLATVNVISDTELELVTPPNAGLLPIRLLTPYGEVQTGIAFLFRELEAQVTGRGLDVSVNVSGIEDTEALVRFAGNVYVLATPEVPDVSFRYAGPQQDQIQVTRVFDFYTTTVEWATLPYIDRVTPERGRVGTVVQLEGGLFDQVEEVFFGGRSMPFTRISDSLIEVVDDG